MDKAQLRSQARAARADAHERVDPAPALAALDMLLRQTDGPVSFYWPIRTEIDPRPVMEALASSRDVCLPVTDGLNPLSFRHWAPGAALDTDGFGVSVPAEDVPVTPRVLVVPCLAFDAAGHRLGYGAGHYDRTLDQLRRAGPATAILLAYAAQEVPKIPAEATDQPMDWIVTDRGTRKVRR